MIWQKFIVLVASQDYPYLVLSCLRNRQGRWSVAATKQNIVPPAVTVTPPLLVRLPRYSSSLGALILVKAAGEGQEIFDNSGTRSERWEQRYTSPTWQSCRSNMI